METKTVSRKRCGCGKAISKYATRCNGCAAQALEAERAIVATGKCPRCSQGIHRNLALAGWWQCDGYGADGFRKPGAQKCGWQTFTE